MLLECVWFQKLILTLLSVIKWLVQDKVSLSEKKPAITFSVSLNSDFLFIEFYVLFLIRMLILSFFNPFLNWGDSNKCRWISNVSESLLFITYDWRLLNILDFEKNVQELKAPIKLDNGILIILEILSSIMFYGTICLVFITYCL